MSEKQPWRTDRVIDHDEAREIAGRLINSHFRKEPHARVGIPARPDYDDDLLISTYIEQQKEKDTRPPSLPGREAIADKIFARLYDNDVVTYRDCLDIAESISLITNGSGETGDVRAAVSPIGQADVEMLVHLADSMGFGRTHDMLRRVIAATPYLIPVTDVGRCNCGVMCRELGRENGCRYARPELTTLRRLVDLTYQHATESETVPSTDTADELIDRALSRTPSND